MINILGLLLDEETQDFTMNESLHLEERRDRMRLISPDAKPLFYFEVFRRKDNSRQVHCLLNDATVLIFNKNSKKLITILIANRAALEKYLRVVEGIINQGDLTRLSRCAKLNKTSNAVKVGNKLTLGEDEVEEYLRRKGNILSN